MQNKFIVYYDSSFAGFLTAIFEIYRLHLDVQNIVPDSKPEQDLFANVLNVETNSESANRLHRGILLRTGSNIFEALYRAFLSEAPNIEMMIYAYIKALFAQREDFNCLNPLSKELAPILKISQSVEREAHLYLGMARFQKVGAELFVATLLPKYNILSLITNHFKRRFPNEQWLLFDEIRKYGYYFNKHEINEVRIENFQMPKDDSEFAKNWEAYYRSASIKERKNLKLLKRCLPVRYWENLPEKKQKLRMA